MAAFIMFIHTVAVAGDLQEGYAGIKWRTPITSLENFVKVGSKKKVDYYTNPSMRFTYAGINISRVTFGFYKDRFFSIHAQIDSIDIFARLKSELQSRFGNPVTWYTSESGDPMVYRWKEGDVKIKLKTQKYTGKMKLSIYHGPTSRRINEPVQDRYYDARLVVQPSKKRVTPASVPLLDF
jgi:hypothetical protein